MSIFAPARANGPAEIINQLNIFPVLCMNRIHHPKVYNRQYAKDHQKNITVRFFSRAGYIPDLVAVKRHERV